MATSDLIAWIFIVLAPVFVLIGVLVFLYKNKELWDAEIKELAREAHEEKRKKHIDKQQKL